LIQINAKRRGAILSCLPARQGRIQGRIGVMTSGEQLYLLLVLVVFLGFALVLGWATHRAGEMSHPADATRTTPPSLPH
jgi:hypothetical protein